MAKQAAAAPQTTPDDADQEWQNGKRVFPLSKPIPDAGEDVTEITFREPTAADIIACGNPVELSLATNPPSVRVDDARMAAMISRLANVPPSSVARMTPRDFIQAGWVLAPFFMPM